MGPGLHLLLAASALSWRHARGLTTSLELQEEGTTGLPPCNPALDCQHAPVDVAVNHTLVQVSTTDPTAFSAAGYVDARLKVVEGTLTTAEAQGGACATSSVTERHVLGRWATDGVTTTQTAEAASSALIAGEPLIFRMGGDFKLCYSSDGSFSTGDVDLVSVGLQVSGLSDMCDFAADCMAMRHFDCYLRKEAANTADGQYSLNTTCAVQFAGLTGVEGKGSWTAEFTAPAYGEADGVAATSPTPQHCGTSAATFICANGGACDAGSRATAVTASTQLWLPSAAADLTGSTLYARTVAACYCPDRNSCASQEDFVQQVGILHYWVAKVCHVLDTKCESDYSGVVAQYSFRIRVECPPGACNADTNNRIKIVTQEAANELPSWHPQNGCAAGLHGYLGNAMVLPDLLNGVSVNPANCDGPMSCAIDGGSRQDYKEFGGSTGFRFSLGTTMHEARTFHEPANWDICYCNENCEIASSWFKVGAVRLSPTRLVSSATSQSAARSQWAIEFVNTDGILGLSRPYTESGVLGLQEGAVVKVVEDPNKVVVDEGCRTIGYDSTLLNGLTSTVDASTDFVATLQTNTPADVEKLVFNSNSFVNSITVKKPGNVAVCYCAITENNLCTDETNWRLVTHVGIRGPTLQQTWQFSTNVNFRLSYEGFGLTSGDSLRIISADGSCEDNNNDPNTAAIEYTGLKVQCPDPCAAVTPVEGDSSGNVVNGDIAAMVLSQDNHNCDKQNSNCQTNDIIGVEVLSETETQLTFQHAPGLQTGDVITLGANYDVTCESTDVACLAMKDEKIAALRGNFDFADIGTKTSKAPSTYMAPHKVTLTTEATKVNIDIGWPDLKPVFVINYAGANPDTGYAGRGGEWTQHSRAITREELRGTVQKSNLKVCWKFAGDSGRYVEEVGKISIIDPATMEGPTLSLTSTLYGQHAPVVLQFKTADGVTGSRYEDATGSLRLKIVILDTSAFDIGFTDIAATIPDSLAEEGSEDDPKQSICGKLFLELWSSDRERGFPMPKGCYYTSFVTGTVYMRELFMLFEGMSGLGQDTTYQIVFNARVYSPTTLGDTVLQVFTMDDVVSRPYEAIESGDAVLASLPQVAGTTDTADPKLNEPNGFKILGGHNDLLRLYSGDDILVELQGNEGTRKILHGHIIRVFLWPLTQWATTSVCQVSCVFSAESNFKCGTFQSCTGLPVVEDGGSNNQLRIVLPATDEEWDPVFNSTKARIRISGITIPSSGFFATRLGAQVTREIENEQGEFVEVSPHYVVSAGDYIWKEPNPGQPVSKVMSTAGGGNALPFRGQQDNTVYVKLLLAATLLARDTTPGSDASLTITLPPGYTCNQVSAAENNLAALTMVPQGRGTPSDGTASLGWVVSDRTCTWTPEHPDGVLYAGTSIIVKLSVDNPVDAMQRNNANNMWTVKMTGKGFHPTEQRTTSEFPFLSSNGETSFYQSNLAVLGKISSVACEPTMLKPLYVTDLFVRVFFRPESNLETGGHIILQVPNGHSFGSVCAAQDLDDFYYATGASPADATLRLPGIASCNTSGITLSEATITLSERLPAGRLFAFKIRVQSWGEITDPQAGWNMFTSDASSYLLDGTPEALSCNFGMGTWGVLSSSTMGMEVDVDDTRPYNMRLGSQSRSSCSSSTTTGTAASSRARVSVTLTAVPMGASGDIYFFLPNGYEWDFNVNTEWSSSGSAGPFPPGPPDEIVGNYLHWFSGWVTDFNPAYTYIFSAYARVPDNTPTSSGNTFFCEIGTAAAAVVDAPQVRAVNSISVDYTSNLQGRANLVQFEMQTVTTIAAGGAIEIVAPVDFTFESSCQLQDALRLGAATHPNLRCISVQTSCESILMLQVPPGENLPPGFYEFAVAAENPPDAVLNFPTVGVPGDTCGTFVCWFFGTYGTLGDTTSMLDYGAFAQGFSIRTQMFSAGIPTLTDTERLGTGRDDRPLQPNNIIFSFQLSVTSTEAGNLHLRGPHGFIFPEECNSTVEVSESTVFGVGNKFSPSYTAWPEGITISNCIGSDNTALLVLDFAAGTAFSSEGLYVFRIGLASNPLLTPNPNRWSIEFAPQASAGESANLFEGMTLWAFTDTSIEPITTARVLFGETPAENTLRIKFRPFNEVPSTGSLSVEASSEFVFVHQPSMVCEVELQELPYLSGGNSYDGHTWSAGEISCLVDSDSSNVARLSISGTYPISSGLEYLLVLKVYNPNVAISTASIWHISSFDAAGGQLDSSQITAFTINEAMTTWTYANSVQAGGSALPDSFSFKMQFPNEVVDGDTIVIEAPPGFELAAACASIIWYSAEDVIPQTGSTYSPLPSSSLECLARSIRIVVASPDQLTVGEVLQFHVDIVNPTGSPDSSVNYWRCTHFDSSDQIESSKAVKSWEVLPQISGVLFELAGAMQQAGATSSVRIVFTPVSDADYIRLYVGSPSGFSFADATVVATNQAIATRDGAQVRVLVPVVAAQEVTVTLENVVLGSVGGQTSLDLTTWSGGLSQDGVWIEGVKQDEVVGFSEGFRLPGRLVILFDRLESEYHTDSALYPVQSLWEVQMSRPAFVTFNFYVTQKANIGDMLKITGSPYMPTTDSFSLTRVQDEVTDAAGTAAPTVITTTSVVIISETRELQATLGSVLLTNTIYQIRLSVTTPTASQNLAARPIYWMLQTTDGGALPKNTNDAESREFTVVEELNFSVSALFAPPYAEIEVSLSITPGLMAPTELTIVAPLGFTFPSDCLVFGGTQVLGCAPDISLANGQATALLTTATAGVTSQPPDLRIRVNTPSNTPVSKIWFVEGHNLWDGAQLGWGEAVGIDVQQMSETAVTYPAVPLVRGRMIWRFRNQLALQSGSSLRVELPEGYVPECDGSNLIIIAFPSESSCSLQSVNSLVIQLNTTIVPDEYVFGFYVTPPVLTPTENLISILLRDNTGRVRDAAIGVAGIDIKDKLQVAQSALRWTNSQAGWSSTITLGFEVLETLPDNTVAPLQQVGEILITFPYGFVHEVDSTSDITILNENMPLKSIGWLDNLEKDRLRITLELNQTYWTTLSAGLYQLKFPVTVPNELPNFNVWHISLCQPNFPGGCTTPTSPAVLVTFAQEGFTYGGIAYSGNFALRQHSFGLAVLAGLLLHLCITHWPLEY